jgi:hypothetical protein
MAQQQPPPPFVPALVALSYDVAELDALIDVHFSACTVLGFGTLGFVRPT